MFWLLLLLHYVYIHNVKYRNYHLFSIVPFLYIYIVEAVRHGLLHASYTLYYSIEYILPTLEILSKIIGCDTHPFSWLADFRLFPFFLFCISLSLSLSLCFLLVFFCFYFATITAFTIISFMVCFCSRNKQTANTT